MMKRIHGYHVICNNRKNFCFAPFWETPQKRWETSKGGRKIFYDHFRVWFLAGVKRRDHFGPTWKVPVQVPTYCLLSFFTSVTYIYVRTEPCRNERNGFVVCVSLSKLRHGIFVGWFGPTKKKVTFSRSKQIF